MKVYVLEKLISESEDGYLCQYYQSMGVYSNEVGANLEIKSFKKVCNDTFRVVEFELDE